MDQEKFGQFIKKIRKENNLTQKDLADKYNVTYQAVSKWENGKNMPDTVLIKQISKDFNISLEELLDGKYKIKKGQKTTLLIIIGSILVILITTLTIIILITTQNNTFQFKTLSTTCKNFKISGNIAYNKNKSAIYISNIKYCGGNDTEYYKKIECTLYESIGNVEKKISTYRYTKKGNIKLEDFLKDVTFTIDNYEKTCKEYSENSLFLSINLTDNNNKITTYKVPLSLQDCKKINKT